MQSGETAKFTVVHCETYVARVFHFPVLMYSYILSVDFFIESSQQTVLWEVRSCSLRDTCMLHNVSCEEAMYVQLKLGRVREWQSFEYDSTL